MWKQKIESKIFKTTELLVNQVDEWKESGHKIVLTNGCFDLLHLGHIDYLSKTADLADKLIIGINSDASVSRLKGDSRPITKQDTRLVKLASMAFVDAVILFDEQTPLALIKSITPNVLAKGGDYTIDTIVGAEEVINAGGSVEVIPFLDGHSSSSIIEKIKND